MLNPYKPEAAQSRPRIQARSPEEEAAFVLLLKAEAEKSLKAEADSLEVSTEKRG
ncbi:hypothetical protein [Rhizobium sp. NFR03]|uniref:hypothetical protein n=1 Tax=Rhizobium sp. NFR03 TaxID=1566263 RepID=UPI0008D4A835|nr:hypothetical protein [Rhizobium sp. NFR03]SES38255.1 hypothetical protein SAMN03159406_03875 [Rhizobium sp. NFR03]